MGMIPESKRLADFSEMVRESTLKRLKAVPPGQENWRLRPDSLSFADLGRHLIDADSWLIQALQSGKFIHAQAEPGMKVIVDRAEYDGLIRQLEESQAARRELIGGLSEEELERTVEDPKFGKITVWWMVVRGNLDHEIHHRGQIAVYLKSACLE
jgi:uncharacterized damage-inducible protein DinB